MAASGPSSRSSNSIWRRKKKRTFLAGDSRKCFDIEFLEPKIKGVIIQVKIHSISERNSKLKERLKGFIGAKI